MGLCTAALSARRCPSHQVLHFGVGGWYGKSCRSLYRNVWGVRGYCLCITPTHVTRASPRYVALWFPVGLQCCKVAMEAFHVSDGNHGLLLKVRPLSAELRREILGMLCSRFALVPRAGASLAKMDCSGLGLTFPELSVTYSSSVRCPPTVTPGMPSELTFHSDAGLIVPRHLLSCARWRARWSATLVYWGVLWPTMWSGQRMLAVFRDVL